MLRFLQGSRFYQLRRRRRIKAESALERWVVDNLMGAVLAAPEADSVGRRVGEPFSRRGEPLGR